MNVKRFTHAWPQRAATRLGLSLSPGDYRTTDAGKSSPKRPILGIFSADAFTNASVNSIFYVSIDYGV